MTQELISKFENMTDRELLIAVCIKTDNFEDRMDKHSAERVIEREQDRKDKLLLNHTLDAIKENHEKRLSYLENERHAFARVFTPILSVIGGGITGWLSRHLP